MRDELSSNDSSAVGCGVPNIPDPDCVPTQCIAAGGEDRPPVMGILGWPACATQCGLPRRACCCSSEAPLLLDELVELMEMMECGRLLVFFRWSKDETAMELRVRQTTMGTGKMSNGNHVAVRLKQLAQSFERVHASLCWDKDTSLCMTTRRPGSHAQLDCNALHTWYVPPLGRLTLMNRSCMLSLLGLRSRQGLLPIPIRDISAMRTSGK